MYVLLAKMVFRVLLIEISVNFPQDLFVVLLGALFVRDLVNCVASLVFLLVLSLCFVKNDLSLCVGLCASSVLNCRRKSLAVILNVV